MRRVPALVKRTMVVLATLSLAFVAVIGFAHTQAGRPLLAVIGPLLGMGQAHPVSGRCPFGFDAQQAPAAKEAARARFAALHRGERTPGARTALGFSLDRTTRAEVQAWAAAHGLACKAPRMGADLDCSNVPAPLVATAGEHPAPEVKSLWFNFGAGDKLVSVIAIRKEPTAAPIETAFHQVEQSLTETAGAPSKHAGDETIGYLAGGLLRQTSVEYQFNNYYAVARASNNGDGYTLIEEYRSF